MTTANVLSDLGNKWLPFPPEAFFSSQRAPDMWFSDELPPTIQDEMRKPLVTQAKMMLRFQLLQQLAMGEQKQAQIAAYRKAAVARSRVGKRVKSSRN